MNADKAGAATNAEDFTKQFMADMFGGGSSAAPPNEAPPSVPVETTRPMVGSNLMRQTQSPAPAQTVNNIDGSYQELIKVFRLGKIHFVDFYF